MVNETMGRGLKAAVQALAAATLVAGVLTAQAAPVSGQGTWESTLKARDINGNPLASLLDPNAVFFYDTVLDLTWLGDWNYAQTSGYDAIGWMYWRLAAPAALDWAANLTVGTFSDWSLPAVLDTGTAGCDLIFSSGTDCGHDVYGSEVARRASPLAHMFYDTLGNLASGGLTNTGPFSNMQPFFYWSGTAYAPIPGLYAWYFHMGWGSQYKYGHAARFFAVAVRPGDVSASAVPEPGSLAILLAGLGVLGVVRRWRTH